MHYLGIQGGKWAFMFLTAEGVCANRSSTRKIAVEEFGRPDVLNVYYCWGCFCDAWGIFYSITIPCYLVPIVSNTVECVENVVTDMLFYHIHVS